MSDTTTEFKVGDRVLVSGDADDVYFSFDGEEVVGVVVPSDAGPVEERYVNERRINVREEDGWLTQYVRPEDLTLIND